MASSIDLYRMRYGEAVANYMAQLEKQHESEHYEDPQDISKIVSQLVPLVTVIIKTPNGREDLCYGIFKP